MESSRIVIEAPPDPPVPAPVNPVARLMPVAMIVAMGGMTALYLTSTDSAARNPMFLFFPVMMLVSLIGTLAYGGRSGAARTGEVTAQRTEYLRYLDTLDGVLMAAAEDQYRSQHGDHPHPVSLWMLAGRDRMWERGEDHPDFLVVRIGVGAQPATTLAVVPNLGPDAEADPVTVGALRRLVDHRATVADVPVTVPLHSSASIQLPRAAARALVCQAAMFHHPDTVAVSVPASPEWDWVKWLPHQGVHRSVHRIVICEDGAAPAPAAATTVIDVQPDGGPRDVVCDDMSRADAVACARQIARYRPQGSSGPRGRLDWPALMGIADPERIDPDALWSRSAGAAALRVPIGVADDGTIVDLDIKEAAAGGLGPHGLCVGATGSGKSEFLRTLVLGMITAHSPDTLNLVLVDFKGGATFLGLETAHHVSAVITNLADEAALVSRMREALSGEVNRRQELLRAAGNLTNIGEYARARAHGGALAPLPALFIIVDEFSELLSQHPDFAELFVAIGRLGRSLGIHLLLASQRLDEGRLRGLETHLSYRICLKTFSASESRAVLGVPDAYHLPSEPGAAYLKTAAGGLTRFQTAFVSGGYTPRRPFPAHQTRAVHRFSLGDDGRVQAAPARQRPLLPTVLRQLAGRGAQAHRVWLAPLGSPPALQDLLPSEPARRLRVPIGVVDRPYEQRRDPYVVDVSGSAGNVAVVGAPKTGKSTALKTIICALATTHDATEVQFYCLDFGGGDLAALRDLPHVGSVAGRRDSDLSRRTVAVVEALLRARESGADRASRGDVFLVIDGWAALRQDFDGLEPAITAIAAQGLSYGIHVMIAASRWADLRPGLKDQIGTRIELRLGDPADSEMDRRRARDLAERPPGRGLTREGRETAIALPSADRVRRRADGRAAPPVELLPDRVERRAMATVARRAGDVVLGLGERDLTPVVLAFAEHPHLLVLGESSCGKTNLLRLLCTELAGSNEVALEIVDYRRTLLGVVETGYSVSPKAVTSRMAALTQTLTGRMPDEHVTQRQLRDRSWWQGPEIYIVVDDYDLVAGATGNPLTPLADFLPHAKDLGLHLVIARRSGGAARAMFDPVLARMRDMGCAGLMMSAAPDEGVLLGSVRPSALPPGRGTLVARGRPEELIQVAWVEPPP
ncbi:type VII secretion protein EccCa [Mycobacterium sp. 236(2023)]|uniref:type VII secretion protein EccCa n=1 Tax=Mycobacterium sp. 236(2023) TaxID=3038163 RepID=UPI0024151BF1|nr:type VII secretion protein EccCa [Mycobacterium sp. 236(2023)]MDG4664015.1 type VII secretion protein EccCa [Mycobacterium sp. 236(2023)]